jgi:hypothetical protein
MALRDNLNTALAEFRQKVKFPVEQLNEQGLCRLIVPIPAALIQLHDNQLMIDLRMAQNGGSFAMYSPVAGIQNLPKAVFWESLLRRKFQDVAQAGISIAIADIGEQDVIVGMYHWLTDSITPAQFAKLYPNYLAATFDLIDEVNQMIVQTPGMRLLHKGRGK